MSDPVEDQIRAASKETAALVARMVPGIGPASTEPIPRWAEQLTGPLFQTTTPRCVHLVERPAQPWFAILHERSWRCRSCMQRHRHDLAASSGLDPVEEHTCDYCRRYTSSLTSVVLRFDMWVIHAALCAGCETALPELRRPQR